MHITILTYGSRGDVQPYIALGVGLLRSGYTVRIAAPENFADFVTGYGLEFAPLSGDPSQLARDLVDKAGTNQLRASQVLVEYVLPLAIQVHADLHLACEGTEAIIHTFLTAITGHEIARQMNVPDFFAQMYPIFTSTHSFPHMLFPPLRLGGGYNRLTHRVFNQMFWQVSRTAYGFLRRKAPDLPEKVFWPFAADNPRPTPILYGFSPQVITPAPDWDANVHVAGYWFLDNDDWQPPQDLLDFLDSGPPPVYIGFGSVVSHEMETVTDITLRALKKSEQRGLFLTGWGGVTSTDLPDDVFVIDSAPHDWLMPRMAAVVHHGGAGTTAAGLSAGAPSILVPFTADQPFWGRRIKELGVGPEPIPRKKLTADKLSYAIHTAVTHQPMRQRAAELGKKIRAEDGVGNAVKIIEEYLGG